MTAPTASAADQAALAEGRPPAALELLRYLEVPTAGWSEFLRREYLTDYIAGGGTKLKLILGTAGTGKSHLLNLCLGLACEEGYATAKLDAYGTRLFPIDRLYGAIVRSVGLQGLVESYTRRIVAELGHSVESLSPHTAALDRLVAAGEGLEVTLRRSFQERVDALLRESALDSTWATAAAQAVGHRLGVFRLTVEEQDALHRWFTGDKVRLGELKRLQIYERADRYSARDYLRSLSIFARRAGFRGLVVGIDNLETVAYRSAVSGRQRYTRVQRDEAFETIRQLIDDVDHSHGVLYLLAGRRELLEDEKAGISSYEALRLRLLQEVRANRFNPFADIVDLNTARESGYLSPESLAEWVDRLRELHPDFVPAATPLPTHFSLRDVVVSVTALDRGAGERLNPL